MTHADFRFFTLTLAFALAALVISACGRVGMSPLPGSDAGQDSGQDAGQDAGQDGSVDADTRDATPDGATIDAGGGGLSACASSDECILQEPSCCESCNPLSLGDVDAINARNAAAHFALYCTEEEPVCLACVTPPSPNLIAICVAGTCEARDLAQNAATACTADAHCIARLPDCCGCGEGEYADLIAINRDAEDVFQSLACDIGHCPIDCAPTEFEFEAYCNSDGHCALR